MKKKEKLFSVTIKDCRVDTYRGSGAGGQRRNKKDTAVRITHLASGAVGQAEDQRSQHQNKKLAFRRMAESDTFQNWAKLEAAKYLGIMEEIEKTVNKELKTNVRTETKDDRGRWSVVLDLEELEVTEEPEVVKEKPVKERKKKRLSKKEAIREELKLLKEES